MPELTIGNITQLSTPPNNGWVRPFLKYLKEDVAKYPCFENDDALYSIKGVSFSNEEIKIMEERNPYLKLKQEKFKNKDISKDGFEPFIYKPSLRNFETIKDLRASIYTYVVEQRNNGIKYEDILQEVKNILEYNPNSRKAILRFSNDISEYHASEIYSELDVTCLAFIHYHKDEVKLVFRAHDIKEEGFSDFINIYTYFIKPIYGENPVTIKFYLSTTQNVDFFENYLRELRRDI